MKIPFRLLGIGILALGVTGCSSSSSPVEPSAVSSATTQGAGSPPAAKPGSSTITQIVVADSRFDILERAVVALELAAVLDGKEQFTVFAPTDDAFMAATGTTSEQAAFDKLLELFTIDEIRDIVLFHVTEGRRISKSVLAAPSYEMLNGGVLTRDKLSAAGILQPDVSASNGIVHVIGGVLIP
jgi:uncharacterized surface protein with fasciclin (FAS1) repeats